MNDLPFSFTDALHIDEPFPWRGIALAFLILWLLYRFVKSLREKRTTPSLPPPPTPARRSRIAQEIKGIRKRYLRSKDFRAGCHELAELLRGHFEAKRREPFSVLTAGEIESTIGDSAISRFFSLLSTLQFGRRPPSKSDFEGACELAIDVSLPRRK